MANCGGSGGKVAVAEGSTSTTVVLVTCGVEVAGCTVTGSAVGTGPTGSMTFLA